MPLTISDLETLRQYVDGVVAGADHHGPQVHQVCLALVGGIVWKAEELAARTRAGQPTNQLRMRRGEQWYVIGFNHDTGEIDVRTDTQTGPIIQSFTNNSTLNDIRAFFDSL